MTKRGTPLRLVNDGEFFCLLRTGEFYRRLHAGTDCGGKGTIVVFNLRRGRESTLNHQCRVEQKSIDVLYQNQDIQSTVGY